MPPIGELPPDVGPAQAAMGLNGQVSQVPVYRVHGSSPSRTMRSYRAGPKPDVTASKVFPVLGLPLDPLLAFDLTANFFFSVCSAHTDRGSR